jgi:hypothetical protein
MIDVMDEGHTDQCFLVKNSPELQSSLIELIRLGTPSSEPPFLSQYQGYLFYDNAMLLVAARIIIHLQVSVYSLFFYDPTSDSGLK